MIKTIYFVFFICAFALGLWACTGKEQEKFKSLSTCLLYTSDAADE